MIKNNLNNLILQKLKSDLFSELYYYYQSNSNLFNISKSDFIQFIQTKISEKLVNINISINPIQNKSVYFPSQCCARIMGPHYTDLRCSLKSIKNTDYCKIHTNRLQEYGYLSFNRYDECRPTINESKNKIPWRDLSPMEEINIIIQYQNMNLNKLINSNEIKSTSNL